MSIKVMTRVWDLSQHEGTALLLLLALADHASDDGVCWPGVSRLAAKTRKTERHVKRLLRQLEKSGELYIHTGGKGQGNTSLYFILLGLGKEEIRATLVERFELESELTLQITQEVMEKVSSRAEKGDAHVTLKDDAHVTLAGAARVTPTSVRVTPTSDKGDTHVTRSITNHQEPSNDGVVQQQEHQHITTLLTDFGVSEGVARNLAGQCTLDQVEGWIALAQKSDSLRDPVAFVVISCKWGNAPQRKSLVGKRARTASGGI